MTDITSMPQSPSPSVAPRPPAADAPTPDGSDRSGERSGERPEPAGSPVDAGAEPASGGDPPPSADPLLATTAELAQLRRKLGMPDIAEVRRAERERRRGMNRAAPADAADAATRRPTGDTIDHQPGHGYGHGRQFGHEPTREHGRGREPSYPSDPERGPEPAFSGPRIPGGRTGEPVGRVHPPGSSPGEQRADGAHGDTGTGAGTAGGAGTRAGTDGPGPRAGTDRRMPTQAQQRPAVVEPVRRVETYDPEKTQILRGLHGRRVPGVDSFRVRHAPSAEGLIPMSGTLTGEFFLGSLTRPDRSASPTEGDGHGQRDQGQRGPAQRGQGQRGQGRRGGGTTAGSHARRTTLVEPVDYGLDDLSVDVETGSKHRAERTTKGSSRSRAIWTLVDQVLSSGTNAGMSFVIAHSVSPSEFGAFAIAFAIFSLMIGFSKAAGTSPLGIRFAGASPAVFRGAAAAGTGTAFAVGLFSGVVTLFAGLSVGGSVGASLVAMGLVFPALLLQDAWRQVFFAEGRPAAAAANDAVWAVVQFGAIFALIVQDVSTSWAMLAAWGGAAGVAALLGLYQAGFNPATRQVKSWLVEHRDINGYMCAEYLTVQGAQQASTLLLGTLGAIDLVGALRGVQTLLGPTTILAVGIVSWAIPEFSRRKDMSAPARIRAAYALSGVIVAVGVIWGTVFLLLPASVGHSLLGPTWDQTHHLLALSIIQQAGPAATVGPACMLYALGKAKLTFRANAILAPQLLVYPVIGLHFGGATGAVVGYIAAFWITVPFWYLLVASAARDAARDAAGDAAPQADGATNTSGATTTGGVTTTGSTTTTGGVTKTDAERTTATAADDTTTETDAAP
ncbi:hypothetical protein [Candidatus Frankia nodulisporulans]|uniref:hypothetical protein n=1 Tax=Candidatus Frankia nodulisporulans TaxID=2060052 RepID=UPI0015838D49|nr:hypothetical protein [Candidatus Frankia nodulisporulans]